MSERATDFDSIGRHCIAIVAAARRLPVEQVSLDSELQALEVDSLDKVSLSFDLEDAYDIDIPDSALFSVKTVGDMARGVVAVLEKRAALAGEGGATHEAGSGSDDLVADAAGAESRG